MKIQELSQFTKVPRMELKSILIALSLVVLVKSVPLSDLRQPTPISDHFDEFAPPALYNDPIEVDLLADDDLNYRLPNNSIPLRYDLWLKTDVEKLNFDFSGQVKIHIRIVEPTQLITLHYRQIIVDKIDLLNVDKSLNQANLNYEYDEPVEFLLISLPRMMAINDEIILDISYHGILREDGTGFYRASYKRDATGETIWFATTQFEMTDARHGMPCYDEPGIRAVTGLQIQHDKSYDAISNMPVSTREPIVGTDYVTTKFQDTPLMQTYLLAFIISDFKFVSNNEVNVEQRIYAKPELIARGDGDFAAGVVGPILRQLEEHFGMLYPLPKMDHAAITDYIWGAMENFGLITYQDRNLLFVKDSDSEAKKKNIIELISHEYVHQYFGNIVSPKWWAYTWLNEGFATLYSDFIPSLLYPDEDYMERFELNFLSSAFNADTVAQNAKPLNFYVQTPIDIRNKFGTISYRKGGSVLRMFQEALTVPTFTQGLTDYLWTMYFKSATPSDLHAALQRSYNQDFPGSPLNIEQLMAPWEDQAGYPIVHVEKSGGQFVMTQQRFGGGNEIYSIPISCATKSLANFDKKTPTLWMTTASAQLPSTDDWIILNIQNTGYYKVSYGKSIKLAVISELQNNHEIISPYHRAQVFKEMRSSLLDESIEARYGLQLINYLNHETNGKVWNEAGGVEALLLNRLFGTATATKFNNFVRTLVLPHITRLGYERVAGEPSADADLRTAVAFFSCNTFQPECLSYELNRLAAFIASGEGTYKVCEGLRLASSSIHATLLSRVLTATSTERANLLTGLGCSLNKDLIKNFLQLALAETNNLSVNERFNIFRNTLTSGVLAFETVLEFIHENYVAIERIIPGRLKTILTAMVVFVNTQEHYTEMKAVFELLQASSYLTVEDVTALSATVEQNMVWIAANLSDIEAWLNNDEPAVTDPSDTTPGSSTAISTSTSTSTSTSQSTEAVSTTLGSSSLIASFAIILACVIVQKLI